MCEQTRLQLIIFSISIVYRIAFNVAYISTAKRMCEFSLDHHSLWAFIQSTMYLVGEAMPVTSIFLMHALDHCPQRSKSDKIEDGNQSSNTMIGTPNS
jgi:hypothetical protein